MKRSIRLLLFRVLCFALPASAGFGTERMTLDGEWRFALGAPEPAFPQGVLPAVTFNDTIALPGTTETRGKGPENTARESMTLTRVRKFDGAAWYQRDMEIPAAWGGQRIELRLERTKYTQLWLDKKPVGEQGRYTVGQVYDLTGVATAGHHRLTLMVDNRPERRPVKADAHQFSDNTQTNWNGVIGRLELVARPAVWLEDVQIYPDVAKQSFRVHVVPGQLAGAKLAGRVTVRAESFNDDSVRAGAPHRPAEVAADFSAGDEALAALDLELPLGEGAKLWDEFSPALYRVTVSLAGATGTDERVIETGLREFRTLGTHFAINGRATFLRGKHDGCVFPLTGHPPMDVDGWLDYLRVCQSYGINHIRCHTWTPPEAAFAAADRLGIYLQPELPFWGTVDAQVRDYLMPEAEALLRAYGNHPSFVMMTLGNEMGGDRAMMNAMVTHLRQLDARHLYSDGSNNVLWEPRLQATNDFWVSARTIPAPGGSRSLPARGSFYQGDGHDGPVQWGLAETRTDLRAAIAGVPVPFVGHEIAQYTTYPNYREIERYAGVTRARNLERFRDKLAGRGMLDQADDFFRASGVLAASLYREEIELALRTPGFGGFQLLDLQDFPGQGTALVGVLDAFMQSKGAITVEEWRRFCSPVVPLARFNRYTWTTAENYAADLEVAHFGGASLPGAVTAWEIVGGDGAVLARGEFAAATIEQGGLRALGHVEASLAKAAAPARYELVVTVTSGTAKFSNRWPLWIYPAAVKTETPAKVTVVRAFDAKTKALLTAGERVVLISEGKDGGATVRGAYATDFWCWPMFSSSPGTMGLLIEAKHPALADFPTAFHSERQWSTIAHASTPVILSAAPAGYRPIVQVIDNLERNDRIGLVFETKVGAGALLVVACDLSALKDDPAARQLFASVLAYAGSEKFAPQVELPLPVLDGCLRPSLTAGRNATASSSFTPPWGYVPTAASAIDGDINTRWQAADKDQAPWLAVDLGGPCNVDTVELLWEHDEPGYRYLVEGSADGAMWTTLSDQRANASTDGRHTLGVTGRGVRQVRVTIVGWPANRAAALREIRVLGAGLPNAAK